MMKLVERLTPYIALSVFFSLINLILHLDLHQLLTNDDTRVKGDIFNS